MADLYPFDYAAGERYEIDNRLGSPFYEPPCAETEIPVEGRARITCGVILEDDDGSPRGRCLVPVTKRAGSQYLTHGPYWDRSPYKGIGLWHLQTDGGSPRGSTLRGHVSLGCQPRELDILEPVPPGIVDDNVRSVAGGQRVPAASRLQPFPEGEGGSPRGNQLSFRGEAGCPNLVYVWVPDDPQWHDPGAYYPFYEHEEADDPRGKLYHFDVFGYRCVSCPILFASFQPPCLGCSFRTEDYGYDPALWPFIINQCGDPFSSIITDWCAARGHAPTDIGEAHCVPWYPEWDARHDPNYHIACQVDQDGSIGPNHCEACVYERNLGRMMTEMLRRSDWLNKIPMRPVYGPPTESRHHDCNYGCGEFGWELWRGNDPHGAPLDYLRLHGEHDKPGGEWLAEGEGIKRKEGPCGNPIMDCLEVATGWKTSGFPWCGKGSLRLCESGGTPEIHCAQTHHFSWRKADPYNKMTKAYICFKQWEWCNPSVQPCSSNPVQTLGGYHNPASDLMVWVECRIELQFAFNHWGPTTAGSCCYAHMPTSQNADLITVQLTGRFCGPIPWGAASAQEWFGYDPDDMARILNYPGTWWDPRNEDGADNRGACGSMFVDQGTYDDFLAGNPAAGLFDSVNEPPKRCPSRLAGPKFWCPPSLDWSWHWLGGTGNWVPVTGQPNSHTRANQCWALQLAKNDGDGCAAGTTHTGETVGCQAPEGRRGCSMRESIDADGLRISPWRNPPSRFTPWGCGHCVDVYPQDPLAEW